MKRVLGILANVLPIIMMIALIPLVSNDYLLMALDCVVIVIAFSVRRTRSDLFVFIFGFCIMTLSEWFFVSTGVEIFERQTFLGFMPLWLPFLWGYGFVAIRGSMGLLFGR